LVVVTPLISDQNSVGARFTNFIVAFPKNEGPCSDCASMLIRIKRLYIFVEGTRMSSMARINVNRMTIQELLALEVKLQKAIARARQRDRAKVKQELKALAEKHGFTTSELFDGRSKRRSVAAKYANPDDPSQTWTGRGRRPAWLVAKMKKRGAKLQDFAL
jgi:DNA-binding protein H-NS